MKRQTLKLKNSGSLVNFLIANNATVPVVGKGATIIHYSDRTPCEVVEISADSKRVVLEYYDAKRTDNKGMSEMQEYEYTLNGQRFEIVWRNGAWRHEVSEIWFTDTANEMTFDERKKYFDPVTRCLNLVEGISFVKKSYPVINIIFGRAEKYHDFSF